MLHYIVILLCSLVHVLPVCWRRRPQHVRFLRHFWHQPIGLQHREPAGHLDRADLGPGGNRQPSCRQSGAAERGEAVGQSGGRNSASSQTPAAASGNRPSELVWQRHRHRQPLLLLWKFLLLHRQPGHHLRGRLWLRFQFASPLDSRPESLYLPRCPWTRVPGTDITPVPARLSQESFTRGKRGRQRRGTLPPTKDASEESAQGDKSSVTTCERDSETTDRQSMSQHSQDPSEESKNKMVTPSEHPDSCHICSSVTSVSKTIVAICSVCGGFKVRRVWTRFLFICWSILVLFNILFVS